MITVVSPAKMLILIFDEPLVPVIEGVMMAVVNVLVVPAYVPPGCVGPRIVVL